MEQDHAFLLQGDVFTPDVIETWLSMKRSKDVAAVNLRPHPYEFFLYYGRLTSGRASRYRLFAAGA